MNIKPKFQPRQKSDELFRHASGKIPTYTQTLSKGPTQFVQGVAPIYVERGEGCHTWDVDGNKYIDLIMGLWSVTLGYGFPEIVEAIVEQTKKGQNLSLMHPLEIEVTDLLLELNPWADMVRFGKNGSDVTTAAIKASRAITGREKILRCSASYHGWHDWYNCHTERNIGVPEFNKDLCLMFDFNDIEGFKKIIEEHGSEIACVIMEGITTTYPNPGFLELIEEITHKNNSLLIFDEIINGFRLANGGSREYFSIDVDMVTFGKGISNGSPLSALVGKKECMDIFEKVFYSFTFGGEPVALAAAKASIIASKKYNTVQHQMNVGQKLLDGLKELISTYKLNEIIIPKGTPVRTVLNFYNPEDKTIDFRIKSLFQQEVIKRGILISGEHALSFAHKDEHIDYILSAYDDALSIIKKSIDSETLDQSIEGEVIQPILNRPS